MIVFVFFCGVWCVFIFVLVFVVGMVQGLLLFGVVGLVNDQYVCLVVDIEIVSIVVFVDCCGFVGIIVRIVLLDGLICCNEVFFYGFVSLISISVYYLVDIVVFDVKFLVIIFVGGIFFNVGNYYELMKLWVSYGFIVVIFFDFINFFLLMYVFGIFEVVKLDRDLGLVLYDWVDFFWMLVVGYFVGGQVILQSVSFFV